MTSANPCDFVSAIDTMAVDSVMIFKLSDAFDDRESHRWRMAIHARAQMMKVVVRVQEYVGKLYVIRVA